MRGKRGFFGHAGSRVRLFCRRLTGKQRILLAGTASFLLAASCLYSILSCVSRFGEPGQRPAMGHIRSVVFRPERTRNIHSNIHKHENGLSENQGMARSVK